MGRLQDIERDLADRQNDWERAAGQQIRLKRDWELRFARAFVSQPSNLTVQERKANALIALAASEDSLYEDYIAAEGQAEGLKAVVNVLQTRATIGQSLLRSMTREFAAPRAA
jgi:hypothetical protein